MHLRIMLNNYWTSLLRTRTLIIKAACPGYEAIDYFIQLICSTRPTISFPSQNFLRMPMGWLLLKELLKVHTPQHVMHCALAVPLSPSLERRVRQVWGRRRTLIAFSRHCSAVIGRSKCGGQATSID